MKNEYHLKRTKSILLTHTRMIRFRSIDKNTKPEFWRAPSDRLNQIMNR